jgi:hypothetical protein
MARDYFNMIERVRVPVPAIMSEHQKNMIRHALGLAQSPVGIAYRNCYSAGRDGPDYEAWRDLEARYLAMAHDVAGGFCFVVSSQAAKAVLKRSESFNAEITANLARIDRQIKEKRITQGTL